MRNNNLKITTEVETINKVLVYVFPVLIRTFSVLQKAEYLN